MPNRLLALVVLLVFAAPGVWLGSGSVTAQTQEVSSDIPRTPDGHPDLTGLYDVATMTPVERPTEYGDRLFLTNEEVAAMVQYEEQRNERDLDPLDPDRSAPRLVATGRRRRHISRACSDWAGVPWAATTSFGSVLASVR